MISIKNIQYFKSLSFEQAPDFGTKLGEALEHLAQSVGNIEQQTNSNASGTPDPPPPINALNVTASNGHFQVDINHQGVDFFRGVHYFVAHADNPHFKNAHVVHIGTARNAHFFFGNATRYFQAYAQYPGSPPGKIAFHGGITPKPVIGGGSIPAPQFSNSQGSGTGDPGVSHSGFGPIPFRTTTGGPPVR